MNRLILARHAKSCLNNNNLDFERPLSKQGRLDASKVGQHLYKKNYIPHNIISSSSFRTLETSELLMNELKYNNHFDKIDEIYEASNKVIINIIRKINKNYKCVMLVGHNPSLTNVTNMLSNVKIDHLPSGGTIILDFDSDWSAIKENGKLIEYINPQKIN